jgi:hypothetical protein
VTVPVTHKQEGPATGASETGNHLSESESEKCSESRWHSESRSVL